MKHIGLLIGRADAAAAAAFTTWSNTGPNERRALLLKAADLMEARTPDFIALMLQEIGATAASAERP